jgi:NADH-quinone oxidoreductase subunit C
MTSELQSYIEKNYGSLFAHIPTGKGQPTFECQINNYLEVCELLKNDPKLDFDTLIDLCGIDYLHYGLDEWSSDQASKEGFSRGASRLDMNISLEQNTKLKPRSRFAVQLQLLSVTRNHRLSLKVYLNDDESIPTIKHIWSSVDWFEREAFDLFGIIFIGHEDLRRILTDYGFSGHPFRKDYPVSGYSEVRYDPQQGRVVYEPVSIEPRVQIPKSIRDDSRYLNGCEED